eukprot:c13611_g1_i1.p1 GENE.c13611_g1_i1~~c13611_g1_i1.p1  ORF type:complete len:238 (+),score=41.26 c13611_g1_i1:32-745(+)
MDLVPSFSAAESVVKGWLGKGKPSKPSTNNDANMVARPARLGVGAKFLPHKAVANSVDLKLKRAVKKAKQPDDRPTGELEDSDEEEDQGKSSAFKTVQARSGVDREVSRSKNKRAKKRAASEVSQAVQEPKPEEVPNLVNPAEMDVGETVEAKRENEAKRHKPLDLDDRRYKVVERVNPDGTITTVKKRTKTRSRQKNLKKDTRPEEQRPTYLTKGAPDYEPRRPRKQAQKQENEES